MPSIYDGSPLELVNNALIYGERDLRQAREYLAECKRQVAAAQISVDHHVEHLARWQEAKRRVLGLPEEENTPPSIAALPGPEPVCVYGCGRKVYAEGNWCVTAGCVDAHTEHSGGDV